MLNVPFIGLKINDRYKIRLSAFLPVFITLLLVADFSSTLMVRDFVGVIWMEIALQIFLNVWSKLCKVERVREMKFVLAFSIFLHLLVFVDSSDSLKVRDFVAFIWIEAALQRFVFLWTKKSLNEK